MKSVAQYTKIAEMFEKKIKEKELAPGDKLPTEKEISEEFNVSRMTVNKAISTLVTKGLVTRTAGKGSFVQKNNNTTIEKDMMVGRSFTKDMESVNLIASAQLLEYSVIPARQDRRIQKLLQIEDDDLVHYIYRLRLANDVPIALSKTYIPLKHLPYLNANILTKSLYDYLDKEWSIHPKVISYDFSALLPNEEEKKLLNIKNTALLKSAHLSIDNQDHLFEYTETLYIGSRYTYHISFFEE